MSDRLNLYSLFTAGALICAGVPSYADELSARGSLQQGDEQLDSEEYYDTYTLEVVRGQVVEVTMLSTEVDAYVIVEPPEGDTYENDDIDLAEDNVNASVRFVAEETGTYNVLVTTSSPGESGKYQVVGAAIDTEEVQSEEGQLDDEDGVSWKGGEYYDLYEIKVGSGDHVIVLDTNEFDGYLTVHTADGSEVIQSDDPPVVFIDGGKKGATCTVVVTSFEAAETGGYELMVYAIGD